MGKSTMEMVDKILAEDAKTAAAQKKRVEKGDGALYPMAVGEYRERIEVKKADAGGMIVCWYGPNGSREVIAKDAAEAAAVIEKYFEE